MASNESCEVKVIPEGKELIIRHGDAPEIFTYQGVSYTARSVDAFVSLVKAKGVKERSVVCYTDDSAKAILDDGIVDRPRDTVSLAFANSVRFAEWEGILTKKGSVFDQKGLVDFLSRREPDEVVGIDLFKAALENFKYVTNIQGDFSRVDDHNYTFMIKVGEAEGSVKLPKIIEVNMEIFQESGFFQMMEVELEFLKPKSETEKPLFKLSCPKIGRYREKALEAEIGRMKESLEGYLVVAGNC